MSESVNQIVESIPRFILPKEFSNDPKPEPKVETPPPPEVKTETPKEAPKEATQEAPKEETEETTGKDQAQPPAKKGETPEQRRMYRAIRKAAEERAAREIAERERDELKAKVSAPPAPTPVGAPKMEDYTDIQEYAKAYAKFESANAIKEYEAKQREAAIQRKHASIATEWEAKLRKADTKYDDFDEVVGELKPGAPWREAIMTADNGEDVAYYLAKHRAEFTRIMQLDEIGQVREIGKIEARLAAEEKTPKQPSKAPAPINPVSGTAVASDTDYKEGMSPEDYFKSDLAKKLRGRR